MYKEIYKQIKKFDNIVIARHIGVDPDSYGSQIGLKEIIKNTFPEKNVYAVGIGSSKFRFLGELDKVFNLKKALLIVLDTPIKRRLDLEDNNEFKYKIKIDHHPFEEKFCDLELIDDKASSVCQMIIELVKNTKLKMNKYAAERLFIGLIADTNRFLYENTSSKTMRLVADIIDDFDINKTELYQQLYMRDMNELRLQGYISQNMIITKNNVGYIVITDEIIKEYKVDAASAGNMINNFTYISELLVWVTFSEDVKQNLVRVSIRSRGPIINKVAQQYKGGGHDYASGIKLESFDQVDEIVKSLDELCKEYKQEFEKQ